MPKRTSFLKGQRSKIGVTRKSSKTKGHGTWPSFGKVGKMRKPPVARKRY